MADPFDFFSQSAVSNEPEQAGKPSEVVNANAEQANAFGDMQGNSANTAEDPWGVRLASATASSSNK